MLIYNTTFKVYPLIHYEWLTWLKEEHIPAILGTGFFITAKLLKLLDTDESDGPTYAVQYYIESKALYNRYTKESSLIMQQKSLAKWGDQFIVFDTLLEVVN